MPKRELHIHLEGKLDPDTICTLGEQAGVPLPRAREDLLQFDGLKEFLSMLEWI